MNRTVWLAAAAAALLSLPSAAKQPPDPTRVRTKSGWVQGAMQDELRAFRGIPFAAPPLGALRWRPPASPPSWNDVRDASAFGPACIQVDGGGNLRGSEDCLTLNVFAAASAHGKDQPVMVFFHGGGNHGGSARAPQFDAPPLALRGVLVVTAQYRLGALGFLGHPALSTEGHGSSSNYALMDQIAALRWVHDNIEAFGGDNDRVMVFGQSAGAYDVQAMLASPPAQGLFSRAGIESGADLRGQTQPLATAEAASAPFVAAVGCNAAIDVAACLRAVPADVVVSNGRSVPLLLTVEPRFMPVDPFDVLERRGSPVPLLMGSTREESTSLIDDPSIVLDEAAYAAAIHAEFDPLGPGVADRILALYPASDYDSPTWALIAVHSDYLVTCQVRTSALAATSGRHREPVWRYLFTHTYENDAVLAEARAFHGAELSFVFGNLGKVLALDYVPTAAEVALSERMMKYWTRFAAHGDPNGGGPPHWRRFDADDESILQLDDVPGMIAAYHARQCDFLASLPQR